MPTWHRLKIGAGGQVLSMSISTDGVTKVINTDAAGASILNNSTSQWDQLITNARMPSGDFGEEKVLAGCYAIAVAPSDSSRIYMLTGPLNLVGGLYTGQMYISSNTGASFTQTAGWTPIANLDANASSEKFWGPKIAVDPQNKDVCIVSTDANGAFITTNAGGAWTSLTGTGLAASTHSHRGVAFDPTSSVVSSKTQGIYIFSEGSGLYHSSNGGTSFSLVPSSPTSCLHGKIAVDGSYYLVNSTKVWRLVGATWTDITPSTYTAGGVPSLCPGSTAGVLYVADDGGAMISTTTANTGTTPSMWSARISASRVASDIPWMANAAETYMTVGDWVLDPIVANKLWFCEGIGVWNTTAPTANPVVWTSNGAGIEELVTNQIISPPSGYPIVANWDRAMFTITDPTTYPSNYGPSYAVAITLGASVDWATANPSTIVAMSNGFQGETSGISIDKGVTWATFATTPGSYANGYSGGCIAASSGSAVANTIALWMESENGDVYYTKNGGGSWTRIAGSDWGNNVADAGNFTITGIGTGVAGVMRLTVASVGTLHTGQDVTIGQCVGTGNFSALSFGTFNINVINSTTIDLVGTTAGGTFTSGSFISHTGWHNSLSLYRQVLVADRVSADTFYLYCTGATNNSGFGGGFFKVTFPAGVATFVRQSFPAAILTTPTSFNVHMTTFPNNSGHGLWTAGEGQSFGTGIQYTRDGFQTFTQVKDGSGANIGQTMCVGVGATKPGNDYPSVYFAGEINSVYGIYRSDSSNAAWAANTQTWTAIGTSPFPLDCVSQIKTIVGDADVWGKFYVGTPCGGCFYYTEIEGTVTTITGFSVIHGHARRHTKMIGY